MGACDFLTFGRGATAKEAFSSAVENAQWESGHGGYSGTIAEKGSFVTITPPAEIKTKNDAVTYAQKLLDEDDKRVSDKWGPAGCLAVPSEPNLYLFFGWASS